MLKNLSFLLLTRCETPVEDLMAMIRTEMVEMVKMKNDVEEEGYGEVEVKEDMEAEKEDFRKALKEANIDPGRVWT